MRRALGVILAFIAGVAVTWWSSQPPTADVSSTAPAVASSNRQASGNPLDILPAQDESAAPDLQAWPADAPTPEQVLYAQPQLMRETLARLTPRIPGTPNLYVLAFAGDGAEDVFRNEAEYISRLFAQRFGPSTHTLVLANHPATLATHPLASWSNLETALAGIQEKMQPDQDILLLYMTSHGDEAHTLLVDMDPIPLDQIGAGDLAGILAKHRFPWKVVVVNACYSGGFVAPLRAPGTLVLTAARADRSSFGCGSDSDITYFGKAWLVDGLNRTTDFVAAFNHARGEIRQWEAQDQLPASEPQMDSGNGIENQLARWREGITPGPPLAFRPESANSAPTAPSR